MSTAKNDILGFRINHRALATLLDDSLSTIVANRRKVFSCANPHSLTEACQDVNFAIALKDADFLVCDGIGLKLIGAILGRDVGPRITGSDYFNALNQVLSNDIRRITGRRPRTFFFGSSATVLEKITRQMNIDYPEIEVCGTLSPPFGEWSEELNDQFIEQINAAKPDVLWVGMTAPKQEKWTHKNSSRLEVGIIGNVGAVFDFFAKTKSRAPQWVCNLGLEWVIRLAKEPKRMWKRTIVSVPKFIFLLINSTDSRSPRLEK